MTTLGQNTNHSYLLLRLSLNELNSIRQLSIIYINITLRRCYAAVPCQSSKHAHTYALVC